MSQPAQQQDAPGTTEAMTPVPDHGEESYRGSGKLTGKATIITGADSGIGRAVAIAFAREGADVLISYLEEDDDAEATRLLVEEAGRTAVLVRGDISDPAHCRKIVATAVEKFGRLDVLVHNAAFQRTHAELDEIGDDEWDYTLATNLSAYFHLAKAASAHMTSGSSIIATSSIQADSPSPELLPYAATKAAITNMTASLSQLLGPKGIRANVVAPGPIWTPLIPSTMLPEKVESFGDDTPLGRAGQPAEVAPAFVLLASDEASYMSGAVIAVTGGKPLL
ncbi:SDR family oxidoreductase [Conyzicola nivalis]|uniref:Oxidoreductase n=1 Tax=Conyzicola nivalis TaxID=1477021 RepID=A0A916SL36_9MICO|nr:SDR family oxidoreductase [Conyzicola nivalis]GGB04430.1 oxidoreductase [Conyzicola nivalis]